MLKFRIKPGAVGFGLSGGNVQELRKHRPILIDLAELDEPDQGHLLITWADSEGKAAMPSGIDIRRTILLTDDNIPALRSKPQRREMDGLSVLLFIGTTEAAMEAELAELIGPQTRLIRIGFGPTDNQKPSAN